MRGKDHHLPSAYGVPLWDLLYMTRYGSPVFKPF